MAVPDKQHVDATLPAPRTCVASNETAASATPALRIYLIRHGETEWSRSGQHTGRTDIPLTTRGEQEAKQVGQRLRRVVFSYVRTSPLQRARQTCRLAALGPTPEIESDLLEWDNGDDEGLSSAEILAARPDWNLFRDGSPNGESPAEISARADRLIARLRTLDGNVAIFSHSHFGRAFAARWIGLPVAHAQPFLLDTASLSILCYQHDRTDQPAIALWNSGAADQFHQEPIQDADDSAQNTTALDRWDNEGGQISNMAGRAAQRDCGRLPHRR